MNSCIVERTISVDNMFRIHPFMAFSSVLDGFIMVTDILDTPRYHHTADSLAEAFIRDNTSEDSTPGYINSMTEKYMESPWVEFKYTSTTVPGEDIPRMYQYLPMEVFKNLISGM